jgi:hypothetical protein
MKKIPLSQSKVALVDDDDFEQLNQWKWYAKKGSLTFYAVRHVPNSKKIIRMHREIMPVPTDMEMDHIDGNGLNNQKINLRVVNHRENAQNRRNIKKASRFPGVTWSENTTNKVWRANIRIEGRTVSLGYYATEEEAFEAYKKAINDLNPNVAVTGRERRDRK